MKNTFALRSPRPGTRLSRRRAPVLVLTLCGLLSATAATFANAAESVRPAANRDDPGVLPTLMERTGMQRTGAALMNGTAAVVQGTGHLIGRTGNALVESTTNLMEGTSNLVQSTGALVQSTGALVDRTGSFMADGTSTLVKGSGRLVAQAGDGMQNVIGGALDLVGIRYRRGGNNSEQGFDCSGFVGYVFHDRLGLKLPRTSREISQVGEKVQKSDLEPGDLVFFKTMRQTFSHVGIYLGNNLFVHAPRPGAAVRVENMNESYWTKRYNGARRIDPEDSQ